VAGAAMVATRPRIRDEATTRVCLRASLTATSASCGCLRLGDPNCPDRSSAGVASAEFIGTAALPTMART